MYVISIKWYLLAPNPINFQLWCFISGFGVCIEFIVHVKVENFIWSFHYTLTPCNNILYHIRIFIWILQLKRFLMDQISSFSSSVELFMDEIPKLVCIIWYNGWIDAWVISFSFNGWSSKIHLKHWSDNMSGIWHLSLIWDNFYICNFHKYVITEKPLGTMIQHAWHGYFFLIQIHSVSICIYHANYPYYSS